MKAVSYVPVKLYSYSVFKRPFLLPSNYRRIRQLGAGLRNALRCAWRESWHGCVIAPSAEKRRCETLDNLGLVVTLEKSGT
jgi:hypothetical protein